MQFTGKGWLSKSQLKLHSKFHAHQFQYFGSKGILQLCLRFDLCHPKANATIFTAFLEAYDQQLDSADHKEAQKKSEEREREHIRLSRQIFHIRRKLKEGTRLQSLIDTSTVCYDTLSENERAMVDLCAEGSWETTKEGTRFVSPLEKQIKRLQEQQRSRAKVSALEKQIKNLQEQQRSRAKKYTSAGSAAVDQMGDNASGKTYRPKAKSFNLDGKGKREGKGESKKSKKGKGKSKKGKGKGERKGKSKK